MSLLQTLKNDHAHVKSKMKEIGEALKAAVQGVETESALAAVKEAVEFIDPNLRRHFHQEEVALFPVFGRAVAQYGEDMKNAGPVSYFRGPMGLGDAVPARPATAPERTFPCVNDNTGYLLIEHEEILGKWGILVEGTRAHTPDPQVLLEAWEDVWDQLEEHIYKENEIMLPMAEDNLTEEEKAEIEALNPSPTPGTAPSSSSE